MNDINYATIIKLVDPAVLDNMRYEHETNRDEMWEQWEYLCKISSKLLNAKQYRLFRMISRGLTHKEIAIKLHVTPASVFHMRNNMIKNLRYFINFTNNFGREK